MLIRWLYCEGPESAFQAMDHSKVYTFSGNNPAHDVMFSVLHYVPDRRWMYKAWNELKEETKILLMCPWSRRNALFPDDLRRKYSDRLGRCWLAYLWSSANVNPDVIKTQLNDKARRKVLEEMVEQGKWRYHGALKMWQNALEVTR